MLELIKVHWEDNHKARTTDVKSTDDHSNEKK